jgi:DNA-directed RNA polymerase subunit RPC12/RpoP
LVHHFRCAYVGPLSDFKKEDHLECPKCNHKLKHIGIDYDKPSEINTCNTCNYSSQETAMKAKCVTCGHDNTLDALRTYHVCEYTPTDMARVKAAEAFKGQEVKVEEYGLDTVGIIAYPVYQILNNHEKQKLDLYNNDLFTLTIEVKGGILLNLNQVHRNNLLMELGKITKPYLKDRDIITINPDQVIECMLIDYKIREVLELIKILEYNLNKMVMDNRLSQSKSIAISYHQLVQS